MSYHLVKPFNVMVESYNISVIIVEVGEKVRGRPTIFCIIKNPFLTQSETLQQHISIVVNSQ